MNPELRYLANTQSGVVTRRQAIASGMTERQLKTSVAPRGPWVVVRRGAYAERWEWDRAGPARRHYMLVVAATLVAETEYAVSHSSAAVVHGLDLRPHTRELVHVSHPRVLGGRTEGGVKHHPAYVPDDQLVTVAGLPVTSLARTAVDMAREYGLEDGVIACDQVLRRGVRRGQLRDVLEGMWSWPHVTRAREAVSLADRGAVNLGESLARLLVIELGYGAPQTQVVIEDDVRRAEVDMLLHGHVFEFDGRQKYVGVARGGFARGNVEESLWDEKQREDWLRSKDLGVSRIIWADLFGVRRQEALRRLDREYRATQQRRSGRHAF